MCHSGECSDCRFEKYDEPSIGAFPAALGIGVNYRGKVEAIDVPAPAPKQCPRCRSALALDLVTRIWVCGSCGSETKP